MKDHSDPFGVVLAREIPKLRILCFSVGVFNYRLGRFSIQFMDAWYLRCRGFIPSFGEDYGDLTHAEEASRAAEQ